MDDRQLLLQYVSPQHATDGIQEKDRGRYCLAVASLLPERCWMQHLSLGIQLQILFSVTLLRLFMIKYGA